MVLNNCNFTGGNEIEREQREEGVPRREKWEILEETGFKLGFKTTSAMKKKEEQLMYLKWVKGDEMMGETTRIEKIEEEERYDYRIVEEWDINKEEMVNKVCDKEAGEQHRNEEEGSNEEEQRIQEEQEGGIEERIDTSEEFLSWGWIREIEEKEAEREVENKNTGMKEEGEEIGKNREEKGGIGRKERAEMNEGKMV